MEKLIGPNLFHPMGEGEFFIWKFMSYSDLSSFWNKTDRGE